MPQARPTASASSALRRRQIILEQKRGVAFDNKEPALFRGVRQSRQQSPRPMAPSPGDREIAAELLVIDADPDRHPSGAEVVTSVAIEPVRGFFSADRGLGVVHPHRTVCTVGRDVAMADHDGDGRDDIALTLESSIVVLPGATGTAGSSLWRAESAGVTAGCCFAELGAAQAVPSWVGI